MTPRTVSRGEVYLVDLNPTRGSEIQKTRPCVIVSPDELNGYLRTFIVAPLTTGSRLYPFRIPCRFKGRQGHIVLDQLRTVDQERLVQHLGSVVPATFGEGTDDASGDVRSVTARAKRLPGQAASRRSSSRRGTVCPGQLRPSVASGPRS